MEHNWDFYTVFIGYEGWWLKGLLVTIAYATGTVAGGLVIGVVCGMGLLANRWWLTVPIHAYVELFRCTPVLVQIIWFFFALPILVDVRMTPFIAAVVTCSIQSSAFFAESFRGGILSIDRGQWEGARAIGMSYGQSLRRVILPQAVKRMIPAFMERSIELMKTTTLVSTVAYADLMFQANDLAQKTFRPLEVYTVVAVMYFILIFLFSQLSILVEHRLARSGESTVRRDAA